MKTRRNSFVFLAFFAVFTALLVINPFSLLTDQPKKGKPQMEKHKAAREGKDLLDSLLSELPRKGEVRDSSGIVLLNKISASYAYIGSELALKYAERALSVARSINFRLGEARATFWYGYGLMALKRDKEAAEYIENAFKMFGELNNKPEIIRFAIYLSNAYSLRPDKENTIRYYEIALKTAREIKNKRQEMELLIYIATVYNNFFEYNNAHDCFEKALKIARELKDNGRISTALRSIGIFYSNLPDYQKAMEYNEKALEYAEATGDRLEIAMCYQCIAHAYFNNSEFTKALDYFDRTINMYEEIDYRKGIGGALLGKGALLHRMSDYTGAMACFNRARKILEDQNDTRNLGMCIGNMGVVYSSMNDNEHAVECYNQSLKIAEEAGGKIMVSKNLGDLGNVYYDMADYPKALELYERAIKAAGEVSEKALTGMFLSRIGLIYTELAKHEKNDSLYLKALDFYEKARKIADETNDKYLIANGFINIGIVNNKLKKYDLALDNFNTALKMFRDMSLKDTANIIGHIADVYKEKADYVKALENFETALKIASEQDNKFMIALEQAYIGWTIVEMSKDSKKADTTGRHENLVKAAGNLENAIKYFGAKKDYGLKMDFLFSLEEAYSALGYHDKALAAYKEARTMQDSAFSAESRKKIAELDAKRELEVKARENVILQQKTQFQQLALSKQKQDYELLNTQHKVQALEIVKKNGDLALLQKDKSIKDLELKKSKAEGAKKARDIAFLTKESQYQSVVRNSLIGAFVLASAIALLIFFFLRRKSRDNKKLVELNEAIKTEQDKSESLLHNILPVPVAAKLKEGEKHLSDYFDEASIVFIDIVDFSLYSSNTTPERLIEVLNNVYTEFDKIAEKYELEKIKTIGDCYMAVSGVPVRNPAHAMAAAQFATEAMSRMNSSDFGDGRNIYFRTGIDCGPVIAGVIGEKKFIYDLWGDAVNTASRMEEFGVTGRIQCTDRFRTAYYRSAIHDGQFTFRERGKIEIKGKGYMDTYFLEKEEEVGISSK